MIKSLFTASLLACSLAACVSQSTESTRLITDDIEAMNGRILDLKDDLSKQFIENCSHRIAALHYKVEELRIAKAATKIVERCTHPSANNNEPQQTSLNGKLLLGAIETIQLTEENISFSARIDTGAATSSLGAYNWRNFERDGEKWVKFSLLAEADAPIYEYPIYDSVKIKQTGTLTEDRIEIKVDIEVGGIIYKNQLFNLSDRSHLDYQLLIGRSFLQDIAVLSPC